MMKRTRLNYLDEWGNVVAELSRVRNVPAKGDDVIIHTLEEEIPCSASYEVMRRTWNADGSEVDVVVSRQSPLVPTSTAVSEGEE
jgi:inorganic pyrophosphatase